MNSEEQTPTQSATGTTPLQPTSEPAEVPSLVDVYGFIIMGLNLVGMGLNAILTVAGLVQSRDPLVLLSGAGGIAINIVFFRLGKGLRAGERQAVYGLCILGGFAVLCGIGLMVMGAVAGGLVVLLAVGVIYIPPIVSAFGHWTAFK